MTARRVEEDGQASPPISIQAGAPVNLREGFRGDDGCDAFGWVRNAADEVYFERLSVGGGSSDHHAGQLGDPRT